MDSKIVLIGTLFILGTFILSSGTDDDKQSGGGIFDFFKSIPPTNESQPTLEVQKIPDDKKEELLNRINKFIEKIEEKKEVIANLKNRKINVLNIQTFSFNAFNEKLDNITNQLNSNIELLNNLKNQFETKSSLTIRLELDKISSKIQKIYLEIDKIEDIDPTALSQITQTLTNVGQKVKDNTAKFQKETTTGINNLVAEILKKAEQAKFEISTPTTIKQRIQDQKTLDQKILEIDTSYNNKIEKLQDKKYITETGEVDKVDIELDLEELKEFQTKEFNYYENEISNMENIPDASILAIVLYYSDLKIYKLYYNLKTKLSFYLINNISFKDTNVKIPSHIDTLLIKLISKLIFNGTKIVDLLSQLVNKKYKFLPHFKVYMGLFNDFFKNEIRSIDAYITETKNKRAIDNLINSSEVEISNDSSTNFYISKLEQLNGISNTISMFSNEVETEILPKPPKKGGFRTRRIRKL
jgi:hypothetical protein